MAAVIPHGWSGTPEGTETATMVASGQIGSKANRVASIFGSFFEPTAIFGCRGMAMVFLFDSVMRGCRMSFTGFKET